MTESKMQARNTQSDTIPVGEQLIPNVEDEGEVSKEAETLSKQSYRELARKAVVIVLGLVTMIIMVYPVLIIPGTLIVILPIEVAIVDRIYGEITQARKLITKPDFGILVMDSIADNPENDQIRVLVYGKRTPA